MRRIARLAVWHISFSKTLLHEVSEVLHELYFNEFIHGLSIVISKHIQDKSKKAIIMEIQYTRYVYNTEI
jgi:hypothetical protein